MEEQDFLQDEPPMGEGLPGWETESITADTEQPRMSDLPDFQDQVIDPTLMEYRRKMAELTALELKDLIEKNNVGMTRKDLQRIVMREKDKALAEALDRVGVKIGELPNGLLMSNPGSYKKNEKVQKEKEKLAFGSPGLYTSSLRQPYHMKGWNVARVNLYQ